MHPSFSERDVEVSKYNSIIFLFLFVILLVVASHVLMFCLDVDDEGLLCLLGKLTNLSSCNGLLPPPVVSFSMICPLVQKSA